MVEKKYIISPLWFLKEIIGWCGGKTSGSGFEGYSLEPLADARTTGTENDVELPENFGVALLAEPDSNPFVAQEEFFQSNPAILD